MRIKWPFLPWVLLSTLYSIQGYAAPDFRHISDKALSQLQKRYGSQGERRIKQWSRMLQIISAKEAVSDKAVMRLANDYFNQIEWKWDIDHWGVEDYWATPIETLGTHAGDCEDFSIGKYFSLTNMGIPTEKLRITYVKALEQNLAHMVLAYYPHPGAEPLILDNIDKSIQPASKRTDLQPVYGFNGDGIWLAKSSKKYASRSKMHKSLPSWGKLHRRIKQELLM